MSLLNRPNDGNHSVLVVIFKLLASAKKPMTRDSIENLCAPGPRFADQRGAGGKVRSTLNTWTELGLFDDSDGDGIIRINPEIKKSERSTENLPNLARHFALLPKNNANLWATEDSRSADFTRALSWVLAQDVWEFSLKKWDIAQPMIQRQLGENVNLLQNDVRWNGLRAWMRYLGFSWQSHPEKADIIDPTPAIRYALKIIFKNKKHEIAASDMVRNLSDILPVLDGGVIRNSVEDELRAQEGPNAWQSPPKHSLSTSLSRALLRLTEDGTLKGKLVSDDPEESRIRLTGRDQRIIGEFSKFTSA